MIFLLAMVFGFSACGPKEENVEHNIEDPVLEEDTAQSNHLDTADTDIQDTGDIPEPLNDVEQAQEILAELSLIGMTLHLELTDINEQNSLGELEFVAAFRTALVTITTDDRSEESPLAVITESVSTNPQQALMDALKNSGKIWLLPNREKTTGEQWFPPENGEDVVSNWIFHLQADDISDHLFWVIVPRNSDEPYVYGFN